MKNALLIASVVALPCAIVFSAIHFAATRKMLASA